MTKQNKIALQRALDDFSEKEVEKEAEQERRRMYCKYPKDSRSYKFCIGCKDKNTCTGSNEKDKYTEFCEWTYDCYRRGHTTCHVITPYGKDLEFNYCPYCGKKIKQLN